MKQRRAGKHPVRGIRVLIIHPVSEAAAAHLRFIGEMKAKVGKTWVLKEKEIHKIGVKKEGI